MCNPILDAAMEKPGEPLAEFSGFFSLNDLRIFAYSAILDKKEGEE